MKLTKKHLKTFKQEVDFWMRELQQLTWDYEVRFTKPDNMRTAQVCINREGKTCCFELMSTWENYPKNDVTEQLCLAAFHEVCHVLFDPLVDVLANTFYNCFKKSVEESLIHILENTMFKKYKRWEIRR